MKPSADAPGEVAISCREVQKSFTENGTCTPVLRGLNLAVSWGEMTLVTGPSGCGKTTLLSLLGGLLRRDAGEVTVLGTDLNLLGDKDLVLFRRRNIGFVFQEYHLLPALTAAENVAVPLVIQGIARREALDRARTVLNELGMGPYAETRPAVLSGGQKQRISIARAFIHDPRIILCDEPTAALDHASGRVVMEMLRATALRPDRAVIVVTHDPRIFEYGHTIAQMDDGKVISLEHRNP
jgi:putative ABC transport system ATP-binding protein